jgi:hypothetical protein
MSTLVTMPTSGFAAQLVVEGTLARGDAERRRQTAGQKVLGRGLANRPCDADGAAVMGKSK